jgi:hypothetical protein
LVVGLAAQDGELVAEHQDLKVLSPRGGAAERTGSPCSLSSLAYYMLCVVPLCFITTFLSVGLRPGKPTSPRTAPWWRVGRSAELLAVDEVVGQDLDHRIGVRPTSWRNMPDTPWRSTASAGILGWREPFRATAGLPARRRCRLAHPTFHNPNTLLPATPLVSGPIIHLPGQHDRVRRDGYRTDRP